MGDIEILACDYCKARISRLSRLLFSFYFTENRLHTCQTVLKYEKIIISDDYHDIEQLLLLMIIVKNKN